MPGKNTAAFGIYPSNVSVENGVDALRSAGFRTSDISALFPEGAGTKEFAHEKTRKRPRAPLPAAEQACLAARWDGCSALAL
jgi:hypothetical protein